MEIDSEFLKATIFPEFCTVNVKTKSGLEVDIWDDGDIYLMNKENTVLINSKELEEIIRVYKLYKTRRDSYLGKKGV